MQEGTACQVPGFTGDESGMPLGLGDHDLCGQQVTVPSLGEGTEAQRGNVTQPKGARVTQNCKGITDGCQGREGRDAGWRVFKSHKGDIISEESNPEYNRAAAKSKEAPSETSRAPARGSVSGSHPWSSSDLCAGPQALQKSDQKRWSQPLTLRLEMGKLRPGEGGAVVKLGWAPCLLKPCLRV